MTNLEEYNKLAENFYGLGAESIEVEDNTFDESTKPWIVAYYVIDNDLHETYNHEELIKELRELNNKIRFYDEIGELGDGIVAIYLSVGITATPEQIEEINISKQAKKC